MYMYRRQENETQSRKRNRSKSNEPVINKRHKSLLEGNCEDFCDYLDEKIEDTDLVTMATYKQSPTPKLDLNMLRHPEAMEELLIIFKLLLKGMEDNILKRIDDLEEKFDETIKLQESKISEMETRLNNMDKLDQQQRQNNLLICGIPESEKENTDAKIVEFINTNLPDVNLKPEDIERSFRAGKVDKLPRPILVKFHSYNARRKVYKAKKHLREKKEKIFINEDLTPAKSTLFSKARKLKSEGHITNTWTYDSLIYYTTDENDEPKRINTELDIEHILGSKSSQMEVTELEKPQPSTSKA